MFGKNQKKFFQQHTERGTQLVKLLAWNRTLSNRETRANGCSGSKNHNGNKHRVLQSCCASTMMNVGCGMLHVVDVVTAGVCCIAKNHVLPAAVVKLIVNTVSSTSRKRRACRS